MLKRDFKIYLEVESDVEMYLVLSCDNNILSKVEYCCIDDVLDSVGKLYSSLSDYRFDLRFDSIKINIDFEID